MSPACAAIMSLVGAASRASFEYGIDPTEANLAAIVRTQGALIEAIERLVADAAGSAETESDHKPPPAQAEKLAGAAPELLAALQEVTDRLAWLNGDHDGHIMAVTDNARAAIAKATGVAP